MEPKMPDLDLAKQAILAAVDDLRDDLVAQTAEFVRIPTVNPYSGDSSAGNEQAGQEFLKGLCEVAGAASIALFDCPSDVFARGGLIGPAGREFAGRPNLVAEFVLGGGSKSVIVNCHVDTVGTDGMEVEPFSGEVREGALWGRGTSDSKGNLIVGLIALRALQRVGATGGRVLYQSVVDEECNGSGAGTLACCLAGYTADYALVLDGSGLYPCTGCNGVATAEVRVSGRAGHAAHGGAVNAIDKAVHIKTAIDQFKAAWEAPNPDCRLTLGVFRAGTLPAIVPAEAVLQMNITYPHAQAEASQASGEGWRAALMRGDFEQAMRAASAQDDWLRVHPATVGWIKDVYPFRTPDDSSVVRAAQQALTDIGRPAAPRPMTAWFDAAHLAVNSRIPVVGLGAGLEGEAHGATEHILLEDLVSGAKAVALALHALLSPDRCGTG